MTSEERAKLLVLQQAELNRLVKLMEDFALKQRGEKMLKDLNSWNHDPKKWTALDNHHLIVFDPGYPPKKNFRYWVWRFKKLFKKKKAV